MALLADSIVCRCIKNSFFAFSLISCSVLVACHSNKKTEKETEKDTLPFYNSAEFDAEWIADSDANYSKIHSIDTFKLTNQLGHTITKDSLNGFIYVANFFFTRCPDICPKMMDNFQTLQDTFINNNQIKLVSFSVMPWADSVSRLKEYSIAHEINPHKWYLLTGSEERIYNLGRKSYFAEKGLGLKKAATEFLHTESMLLIDKKGRIRGIYNATQKPDIERVTENIRTLLKE